MAFLPTIGLAFRNIRGNKLRTGITVAIIAFGIMALVGIITAIEAMNQKLTESFSSMGANGFAIRYKQNNLRIGGSRDVEVSRKSARTERRSSLNRQITQQEAEEFVRQFRFPSVVGISTFGGREGEVSYQNKKTTPNVVMFGGDENYVGLNGYDIEAGRNFTRQEISSATAVCLVGYDVAVKLFKLNPPMAVGKMIKIKNQPYLITGILASRGSTFGFSRDNLVIMGYRSMRRYFPSGSFVIGMKAMDVTQVESGMGEAELVFRAVRKLKTTEESNFAIERSDSLAEKAINVLGYLTAAIIVIGFITLIGSAIGLMNIMLVSVSERTREVGLIKAIGGRSSAVRAQFLTEALIISVLGAALGIVLGIAIGNLFSIVLGTGFVVPWRWIVYGIIICSAVGLLAGLYPAIKAGRLNPIEALRYE